MDLQLRQFDYDHRLVDFLLDHIDISDETDTKAHHAPSRAFVRDLLITLEHTNS